MKHIVIHEAHEPPLAEADIVEVERKLGATLPPDYRSFLLANNGGSPEPDVFPISGFPRSKLGILNRFFAINGGQHYDLMWNVRILRDRVPPDLLPIADDPGGNLMCLSISGPDRGKVFFWFHEEEAQEGEAPTRDNLYFIANSFDDFLESLTEGP